MGVEYDFRDVTRTRVRPSADPVLASGGRLGAVGSLRATAGVSAQELNAFTGTPAQLTAPVPADGTLVERALACAAAAMSGLGVTPPELVPDAEVQRTSAGSAVVHLHQHHRGIPVFEAVRSVRFDPDGTAGEVLGDHVAIEGAIDLRPVVSAADAVLVAARRLADAGAEASPEGEPIRVSGIAPRTIACFPLPSRPTLLAKRPFREPVTAQLVLFYCAPGDLRLAWRVSLATPDDDEEYDLVVAANGKGAKEVLYCKGSFHTAAGRGRIFRHNPDDEGGRVELDLPLPRSAYPPLATLEPTDPFGRPWIEDRRTRGNNAVAFRGNRRRATLEGQRDDGVVVFAPQEAEGEDQRLLNAFYYCNFLHDFFALLGFGEAEGAFQRRNFTGAAGERDELEIRVFEGTVAGTARLRSRRDGRPGQLLLGLKEGSDRHAALDADLVYHEYAHGVSNRLVGGRLSVDPLRHPESRALGEGYSDYFALTIQSWQLGREKVVFGDWLAGDDRRGLRRHAYDEAFPLHFGDLTEPENQAPHAGGEIWGAALVRMNRAIGRALGDADRGHEIGWQLVVDSLTLLPVGLDQPGFLAARDSILHALAALAGRDSFRAAVDPAVIERAVREAFARTGMGPNARGRGAHFQDLVADFTLPDVRPFQPGAYAMNCKWSLPILFALLFCCSWVSPLAAQDGTDTPKWTTWIFQGENDALAAFSGSDEHYTNGLRFFGLRHPDFAPRWADSFGNWWCSWACPQLPLVANSFGFAIGQNLYTPDDLSVAALIPDDRPYAAWLYGALLLQITDLRLRKQHAFELQLGVIGPAAGGEWLQTEIHKLIDDELPQGWDNQLPDEPGINLIYRYRRRFGGESFDFVPHVGGAVGTIMVMANAGATLRAGWNISGFPQTEIPTTAEPSEEGVARPRWEFYFFVGADGRAIAHNIFLDGTVFRDSHSVEKEDFVYDLRAGFSVRRNNWRFNYTFVRRSEEFFPRRGRFDGIHDFGSLTIGVERAF